MMFLPKSSDSSTRFFGGASLTAAVLLLAGLALLTIPVAAESSTTTGSDSKTRQPHTAGAVSDEDITLDFIADQLAARIDQVHDVSATVTFVQISSRDGSRTEGELRLAAIFPDLIRTTWLKPEFYSGVFYILDTERNLFTQYAPATGEARKLPLDEVLDQRSSIPLTPEQLFMLPPTDQFELSISKVEAEHGTTYAVVAAKHRENRRSYRLWVDTLRWLVTRVQSLTAKGEIELSAEAKDVTVNQGLSAAFLRRLPPGTVEKSFP